MKKQETVFEALKDIYHHLKEWAAPDFALKRGVLLPIAIVSLCFSNLIFFQKNNFKHGFVALVVLITAVVDFFIYWHLLKKTINDGKLTEKISIIVS